MKIKKFEDGVNTFCQVSEEQVMLQSKAEVEKELKSVDETFAKMTKEYNEKIEIINEKLAVFN